MKTTVVGSYPKVTDDNQENLPGLIDRWQKQQVNDAGLEQALQGATRRVIQEQERAGLDLITDGQIRWEDLTHPVGAALLGVTLGGLRRYFDNNVYYRRPLISGAPTWTAPILANGFQQARGMATKPLKVALPGPLTFTVLAEDQRNGQAKPERLLREMTSALRKEVEALAAAGATHIQLDEPALEPNQPMAEAGIQAINDVFRGIQATRWVALYFHDVTPLISRLAAMDADVLSLDLVTGPALAGRLSALPQQVALGVLDARNTQLESPDAVAALVDQAVKGRAARVWLTPNCGLEFLPHGRALQKLELLVSVARRVAGQQTPHPLPSPLEGEKGGVRGGRG
ncbi:MAG: hypothetical protein HY600_06620 [Candidatus Omnitrophica bacterium]|nr:hypothetical protein [Candidatus Omnitrophota bacterium]